MHAPSLIARVNAAESTIKRFGGEAFAWGSADCLRLVAFSLRELGRAPPLREAGAYRTHLGARKALKRTGHATLGGWVDAWGLRRIPPATALPADVLAFATDDPAMPSLALALSNGRVLGFDRETGVGAVVALFSGVSPTIAWSV